MPQYIPRHKSWLHEILILIMGGLTSALAVTALILIWAAVAL